LRPEQSPPLVNMPIVFAGRAWLAIGFPLLVRPGRAARRANSYTHHLKRILL
jgi:hypothetical protein